MSKYTAIAYNCDRSMNLEQNAVNLQGMIDKINAEVAADGWRGVRVAYFYPYQDSICLQVEPGVSALTLDYLRSVGVIHPIGDGAAERVSA